MFKFHSKMIVQVHFYMRFHERKNILPALSFEPMTFYVFFSEHYLPYKDLYLSKRSLCPSR